jgi:hypothetical protein
MAAVGSFDRCSNLWFVGLQIPVRKMAILFMSGTSTGTSTRYQGIQVSWSDGD